MFRFCVLAFFLGCSWADITTPPTNTTQSYGGVAILQCVTNNPESDIVQFKNHIVNPTGDVIFDSSSGEISDPVKYDVVGEYALVINDLGFADGGHYSCETIGVGGELYPVQVIAVGYPEIYAENLVVGGPDQKINCQCDYGATKTNGINEDSIVWVEAFLDDVQLVGEYTRRDMSQGEESTISLAGAYTPNMADNGKTISCRVFSEFPAYSDTATQLLVVTEP